MLFSTILSYLAFGLVKSLVLLYTFLTYPIYAIFFRSRAGTESQGTTSNVQVVGHSERQVTFRSTAVSCSRRDEVLTYQPARLDTLTKLFAFIVAKYGNRRVMGTRKVLGEEKEKQANGKELNKLLLQGEYSWLTYKEVAAQAAHFGKGLRELCGVGAGDRVCLFSDTRAEWMIAATGCFSSRVAICTVYTNLGEEGIAHGINQTEVATIITSVELLPKLVAIKDQIPQVKNIIFFESPVRPQPDPVTGIVLHSFSSVLAKGKSSSLLPEVPTPDDVAVIMYTSGSTGVPKGVILSNKNMVSGVLSLLNTASAALEENGPVGPEDTYIAFLPLAHVLEMLAEHVMMLMGIKIGYSSPNTLTDKGTMIKTGERGDAILLRPTVMAAVPLVLDRVYKGIKNTIAEKGTFSQLLVGYCFEYRSYWSRKGFGTPIMDTLIFSKMKAILGGQLRVLLSGGAPLSEDAQSFIRTALTCKLLQGYGLTETCSTATIGDPQDLTTGQVGPPLLGVDLRIENWEEAGYTVKDTIGPRGEIIIGGDNVSSGYFKMTATDDFFNENGRQFFRTGDIGQALPNGSVKIIDRKKDLVKLQAGEYVSLGKVESNLKINPLIENICVYGDSHHVSTIALVVPDEEKLQKLAETLGRRGSREQLCKDPAVVKAVYDALVKHAAAVRSLEKFEVPRKIRLMSEQWTPESGLVTAAFKLKRKPIQLKYSDLLDEMYLELVHAGSEVIIMPGNKKKKKVSPL